MAEKDGSAPGSGVWGGGLSTFVEEVGRGPKRLRFPLQAGFSRKGLWCFPCSLSPFCEPWSGGCWGVCPLCSGNVHQLASPGQGTGP